MYSVLTQLKYFNSVSYPYMYATYYCISRPIRRVIFLVEILEKEKK
jgi:hypothetical protein